MEAGGAPFPPSLGLRTPDDTVFYSLYPDDDHLSLPSLHGLHLHILTSLLPSFLPSSYIFQHDPFTLTPSLSPLPHLHGRSRFGDNLDDEWLIAALLFHISRSLPSLSIHLSDSDGQFLLIEAAFHLPRWLRPDSSLNRVFIRGGLLHIIPPDPQLPEPLPLPAALRALRSGRFDTRASDPVQAAVQRRISAYPAKAVENMHRVRVRVPLPVAKVLREEPCLISLAVEGFYDRDVDSMKHAMRMERFLGSRGGEEVEMVTVAVTMSRVMYGQLVMQKFQAPKGYPMPVMKEAGSVAYGEAELGMKITCGFEMMYQERKKMGEEGRGGTWEAFLGSLESSGVFQGLLPGSKEYQRIMDGAMEYYRSSSLSSRTRYKFYFLFTIENLVWSSALRLS